MISEGGNGLITRTLLDAGFEAVLVEPGESGVLNAARRGIPTIICATLATAEFRSASLPAAGLFDVLEHIEDEIRFLRELHRCLLPGGRLYLTVPAYSWLWSDDDLVAGHFRRHTLRSVHERLRLAGFAPLYSSYLFSLLPFPLFAARALPSLFGRRPLPRKSYKKLHRPRARGLTDPIWRAELRCLERGGSIPFGSSCLAVAEKR